METTIRRLSSLSELTETMDLQRRTWQFPDTAVVPHHILHIIAHTGGQILGGFSEDNKLIAFSLALLSKDKKTGEMYLSSHMTAVDPSSQCRSIGYQIKIAQKKEALKDGFRTIRWTFDPMETRNANLNLRKLGAYVTDYYPNYYGELKGGLHNGLPSDRFLVEWDLERAENFALDIEKAEQILVNEADEPVIVGRVFKNNSKILRLTVPQNFMELKGADLPRAGRWQEALRSVGTSLLADHRARIVDFEFNQSGLYGSYVAVRDL